jgi:hypothetical protein
MNYLNPKYLVTITLCVAPNKVGSQLNHHLYIQINPEQYYTASSSMVFSSTSALATAPEFAIALSQWFVNTS